MYLAAGLGALPLVVWVAASGAEGSNPPEPTGIVLTVPTEASIGAPLFTLPWGDGPAQVGLSRGDDEETRGPEAFGIADDGRIALIDSVNRRLLLLEPEGRILAAVPVDLAAPRFVAATAASVYVLDADEDLRLLVYSWSGDRVGSASVGPFEDPVTALLVDADGRPIVECGHETTLPALLGAAAVVTAPDTGGGAKPDLVGPSGTDAHTPRSTDRLPVVGRPVRSNPERQLSGRMLRPGAARVEELEVGRGRVKGWDLSVGPGSRIDHIVSLDALPEGGVVVGFRVVPVEQIRAADGRRLEPLDGPGVLLVTRLGDESPSILIDEGSTVYLGAPYVLGPDGAVYSPKATDDGYQIIKHSFPEVAP